MMMMMMMMCPSMYTVVLSQLRNTILMIVAVLNLRRYVHRSMIIVLEQNFDDSDGDYVPQHVRLGNTTVCNTLAMIVTVITVRRCVHFRLDHHYSRLLTFTVQVGSTESCEQFCLTFLHTSCIFGTVTFRKFSKLRKLRAYNP